VPSKRRSIIASLVKLALCLQTLADLVLIGFAGVKATASRLSALLLFGQQCSSLGKGDRAFARHPLRLSAHATTAYRHVTGGSDRGHPRP